ncbi:MAG TPA: Ger(x)C family spore germination protein, partial [Firmicutes bacterium]|nr:Ger(x)C family spore germination protein [Bacillota bacterium]
MRLKIRRLLSVMSLVCLLCAFTGCRSMGGIELKDRSIIQAIGIDKDGDQFKISLQAFSPQGEGGQTAIDISKSNAIVITGTGKTISEALVNAGLRQGKTIFFGHNRLVVLGEEMAKEGIEPIWSYFNADNYLRPNMYIIIAKGMTAEEIISAKISEGILSAENIENAIKRSIEQGNIVRARFLDLLTNRENRHGDLVMPVVQSWDQPGQSPASEGQGEQSSSSETSEESSQSESSESSQSSQSESSGKNTEPSGEQGAGSQNTQEGNSPEQLEFVKLGGSAVFKSDKLIGYLNDEETKGLTCLRNTLQQDTLIITTEEIEMMSTDLYTIRSKIYIGKDGDRIRIQVRVRGEIKIDEAVMKDDKKFTYDLIDTVEEEAESQIQSLCEMAMNKI